MEAMKSIFRYIKTHLSTGITFSRPIALQGYVDADWATDRLTMRSTTGIIFVGTEPVCWQSKLQNVVALSATKAEYVAMNQASSEAMRLRWLLQDPHKPQQSHTYP